MTGRGRRAPSPPRPAAFGGAGAVLAVLLALAGCGTPVATGTASGAATGAPTGAATTSLVAADVRAGVASAVLATIAVRPAGPIAGYGREEFGASWTDRNDAPGGHNGCDTRNDILRRDLVGVRTTATSHGCKVASGALHDPYTGSVISFVAGRTTSAAIQIDHVVALGDAWTTGASSWPAARRVELANDPLNLLAVDAHNNESKGDADAAAWLPPVGGCAYAARQVAVKHAYGLWTTAPEHAALARVLRTCPGQRVPRDGATPLAPASADP